MPGKSGARVSADTLLSLSAVWRATNLISQHVGGLPLNMYQVSDHGRTILRTDPRQHLLRHQACAEINAMTFRQTLTAQALLRGNGYAYIVRDEFYKPVELWPLPPDTTTPVRVMDTGKLWYVTWINGKPFKFSGDDCIHIHGLSPDGMVGYSVVRYMAEDGGLALATRDFASRFMANDATPGGTLEVPNALSDAAYKRLKDSWNEAHMGFDKAHRISILEEGTKFGKIAFNAQEAQLLESRKFSLLDIANYFGVPPHKIGDSSRTSHSSIEAENQSFLDDGLQPWLLRWESECRAKLLTTEEQENGSIVPEFDRKALVRADLAARTTFYQSAVGGPYLTANEARDMEGMPAIPGGDDLYLPANTNGNQPSKTESDKGTPPAKPGETQQPAKEEPKK